MEIICFGDSLTEGWIDDGKAFHPYTDRLTELLIQENPKNKVLNYGISGETIINGMVKRLPTVLENNPDCDLIIFQGGTNDILQFPALANTLDLYQYFSQLMGVVTESKIPKVLVLTMTELYFVESDGATMDQNTSNALRLNFNQNIRQNVDNLSTNTTKLSVCDMEKELPMFKIPKEDLDKFWDDFIHPTAYGYDRMGEIIFRKLKTLTWV